MSTKDIGKLVVSLVVTQAVGGFGVPFVMSAQEWYMSLKRPSFMPPDWLFGPVWIMLYVLIGVAAFLVWQKGVAERRNKIAMQFFIVQLLLNGLWPPAFFGLKSPLAGMVVIVPLFLMAVATALKFFKVDSYAGWLMVPYVFWVGFAAILNGSLLALNI